MNNKVYFYSIADEFGEFSNFAPYPVKIKGKTWPTSEHYFQAMKFESVRDQEDIRRSKTPMEAARKGRSRKKKIKRNWNKIKNNIMYEVLIAKFTQHSELLELLLSTKNLKLVEHTDNDNYWGDGGNGSGKNHLGLILMKVRENLSEH